MENDRVKKWILINSVSNGYNYQVFSCEEEILIMYRIRWFDTNSAQKVMFRSDFSNTRNLKVEYWKNNNNDWKLVEV